MVPPRARVAYHVYVYCGGWANNYVVDLSFSLPASLTGLGRSLPASFALLYLWKAHNAEHAHCSQGLSTISHRPVTEVAALWRRQGCQGALP